MNNLQLSLKTHWFEMTKTGVKKEDYRDLTPFWYARLCLYDGKKQPISFWEFAPRNSFSFDTNKVSFVEFGNNIMTLGYPKSTDTERILKIEHKGIEIGTGTPDWGAIEGKLYFVVKHGAVL